jgi:hypothetical protein
MTPNSITPGDHIHHWTIIAVDGRRVTAQCKCHQVRIITIEDLFSGVRTSCGCRPAPKEYNDAAYEARQERQRRRNFSWKLERGR